VLIFRRIHFYTCSICYCHSIWEFLVACSYTAWVRTWPPNFLLFSGLSFGISSFISYSSLEVGIDEFLEFIPSLSLRSAFSIFKILFSSSSFAIFCSKLLQSSTRLIKFSLKLCNYKPPGTLIESDSSICSMCTTLSSWRWVLEARNM